MKVNGKEFITMSEMAHKTGKNTSAIKQWLCTHGIKPVSRQALYDPSVLDILLAAPPPGKPKKQQGKSKNKTAKKK